MKLEKKWWRGKPKGMQNHAVSLQSRRKKRNDLCWREVSTREGCLWDIVMCDVFQRLIGHFKNIV